MAELDLGFGEEGEEVVAALGDPVGEFEGERGGEVWGDAEEGGGSEVGSGPVPAAGGDGDGVPEAGGGVGDDAPAVADLGEDEG